MASPHATILAPSILGGDHARLADSLARIAATELAWVHVDIMDAHFVPNLSFGPQTVAALRPLADLFFDVHLMLDEPHRYIESFAEAGADEISVHVEPDYPVAETLERIRGLGRRVGVALNPDTPAEAAEPYLDRADIVLCMTVHPGFGGQRFRHDVLPKVEELDRARSERGLAFRLEVDGGIDESTAQRCRASGVDTLVAGSAFFRAEDPKAFARGVAGA